MTQRPGVAAAGVHGFASITDPVRRWVNTVRICTQPDDAAEPEPDLPGRLRDAQLEQFAEDVARGIGATPEERHAIILSRKGAHHALIEAVWKHVDQQRGTG